MRGQTNKFTFKNFELQEMKEIFLKIEIKEKDKSNKEKKCGS